MIPNPEPVMHAKLEDAHLNLVFIFLCTGLDEKEKGHI